MSFPFVKMHGCGNDFVVVDWRGKGSGGFLREEVGKILDRRFGIGADSLLVLEDSDHADAKMRVFERNAQESENCGNGLRCVARFLKENGMETDSFRLETLAGLQEVSIESFDRITVQMGKPIFEPKGIPMIYSGDPWGAEIETQEEAFKIYPLSMGNPHAVIFVNSERDLQNVILAGPEIELLEIFPNRTNVEFVWPWKENEFHVRVWERGAGETFACGTGACAVAVAAIRQGLASSPVLTHFPGGILELAWKEGEQVAMTGPAERVYEGVWKDD